MTTTFPYAGKSFTLNLAESLQVINSYSEDGKTVYIEFLNGDLKGTKMDVPFKWKSLSDGNFLISWQEADKSTVVHCDNFEHKNSHAFYTMMDGSFFVMEGSIEPTKDF
ncbi:hypothetical protein [Rouxiella sp. WC2420]|uniref:MoaF-like domain-containing protein n=1 Tax=Rouxiella sp. WC2420 TaxID=3234145 RepID=A0AB39VTR5_9GAMM